MKAIFPLFILLILSPVIGFSHEGHGFITNGIGHYVFTPEHAVPGAIVLWTVVFVIFRRTFKKTA